MRKYNYIVSVIMMALGGYILYEASAYEIGTSAQKNPALWLQFLAGALILLSVALIIETIFSHAPEMDTVLIDWKSTGMKKVYMLFGFVVGFVIIMKIFGMLVALFCIDVAIEWIMGCRNKKMLIGFPLALMIFVYLFFGLLMKLTLPGPIWM